jgi:hypothetical protein
LAFEGLAGRSGNSIDPLAAKSATCQQKFFP